jgi:hypothetical protein
MFGVYDEQAGCRLDEQANEADERNRLKTSIHDMGIGLSK